MNTSKLSSPVAGVLYGVSAYGIWGLVLPLYFKLLGGIAPLEVLAHRVVWSVVLLVLLLGVLRRWPEMKACLRRPALIGALAVSAALMAGNWFVYIYGVMTNQVLQASLGYYICPLLNVLLGVVFLRERLRPMQGLAVLLAGLGVGYMILAVGVIPWLALALAGSFAGYALIRKLTPVDGLIGVSVESLLMGPLGAGYLAFCAWQGTAAFTQGVGWTALLMVSGVLTAVPLLCFGQASRRLPLSTLGFLQYLTPSLQLGLAITAFHEPLTTAHAVTFSCIWAGLLLFSIDSVRTRRKTALEKERGARREPTMPVLGTKKQRCRPAPAVAASRG
jgi:chloramphenicol-sensitive protein RarD